MGGEGGEQEALDILQQASAAASLSSTTCATHAYFENRINCGREEDAEEQPCEAMLQVLGVDGISWPPNTGLTLCCWFRIDSLAHQPRAPGTDGGAGGTGGGTAKSKPSALLFCLRPHSATTFSGTKEKVAMKAALTNGVLSVESPGRFVANLGAQSFDFGRLYHLVLVYQRQRLGTDTLTLYVDGREVEEQKVMFEKNIKQDLKTSTGMLKQKFDILLAGDAVASGQDAEGKGEKGGGEKGAGGPAAGPAVMRLGNACILDDAMPAKYINALFLVGSEAICQVGSELGPSIPHDILSQEVLFHLDKCNLLPAADVWSKQAAVQKLCSGTLLAGVRLSCSASSVCCYRQYIDFSAAVEPDNVIAQMVSQAFTSDVAGASSQVLLHPSVQSVHPLPFAEALRMVGGVDILLSLISSAETTAVLNRSLALLVSCVRLKVRNQEKLCRVQGYALLAHLLQRKAKLMDGMSLHAIFELVGINSSNPALGALSNEAALREVVFYNPLWELVGPKLASEAYKILSGFVMSWQETVSTASQPAASPLCATQSTQNTQHAVTASSLTGFTSARLVLLGAVATWLDLLLSLAARHV